MWLHFQVNIPILWLNSTQRIVVGWSNITLYYYRLDKLSTTIILIIAGIRTTCVLGEKPIQVNALAIHLIDEEA